MSCDNKINAEVDGILKSYFATLQLSPKRFSEAMKTHLLYSNLFHTDSAYRPKRKMRKLPAESQPQDDTDLSGGAKELLQVYIKFSIYIDGEESEEGREDRYHSMNDKIQTVLLSNHDMVIDHLSSPLVFQVLRVILIAFLERVPSLRSMYSHETPISRKALASSLTKVSISLAF